LQIHTPKSIFTRILAGALSIIRRKEVDRMRTAHLPRRRNSLQRALTFEGLEQRLPLASDFDDSLSEATPLATITTSPRVVNARVDPDTDVDLYRFNVAAGQTVDFDIDTPFNGPGGLGSYLRLFDSTGRQIAFNNDGAAAGETAGFDAYLRHTFASGGTYYIGVSNWFNASYDPVTGDRDTSGGTDTTGDYRLTVQGLPNDTDDTLTEAVSLGPASTTPRIVGGQINPDNDVDIFRFTVNDGQVVDFDIDTALNGPGGLGSYLRLFNSAGQQINVNNDGAAPGETQVGFDAYLRHEFAVGGTYFIAVSNFNNANFDPVGGGNDSVGGDHATGDFQLTMTAVPPDGSSAAFATSSSRSANSSATDPSTATEEVAAEPTAIPATAATASFADRVAAAFPAAPPAQASSGSATLADDFFAELGSLDSLQARRSLLFGV
jgi:hypothetical protein